MESAFLCNGDQLVSGSEDGQVYVYDLVSSEVLQKLDHSPNRFVHSLSTHPTKNGLLLTAAGHKMFVWKTASAEEDT